MATVRNQTIPLLISTGFLKFPLRHSFQTGIKISVSLYWNFFSVLTEIFFSVQTYNWKKISVSTEKKFQYKLTEFCFQSSQKFFFSSNGYFKKPLEINRGIVISTQTGSWSKMIHDMKLQSKNHEIYILLYSLHICFFNCKVSQISKDWDFKKSIHGSGLKIV